MSLDLLAIILSSIALIATGYNLYLQYFKVEIVCYTEMIEESFFLFVENTSSNLAHNYTIQVEKIDAPQELTERFLKMPLLYGKVPFSLSPKKHMSIFVDTHVEAYMKERDAFPTFTLKIFDAKGKSKGTFDIDFNMYYNKMSPFGEAYYLRKELKYGFKSLENSLDKVAKKLPQQP